MNKTDISSLFQFSKNVTSQYGEDGIISEIFKRISSSNKICVEFGAWDGIHCSNTFDLWHNKKWEAVLIEADSIKFNELIENTKEFTNVKAINKYVDPEGQNSLDYILSNLDIAIDFDLLSIDIDGDDFYILEKLNKYRPKLIVVEYNPTIPPHLSIVQNRGEYFGSSAKALIELGKTKGYRLVHLTDTNVFMVHCDYFDELNINEQNIDNLFPNKYLNYIYSSYSGDLFVSNDFVYGVKKQIKEIFSFWEIKIIKTNYSLKFPFSFSDKSQKIIIIDSLNQKEN